MHIGISYVVCVKNEFDYLKELFPLLLKYKWPQDEIIVIDDFSEETNTKALLRDLSLRKLIKLFHFRFQGSFGYQRNYANSRARRDWIFMIDADEKPHETLIKNMHILMEVLNGCIDVIAIPRINGLTNATQDFYDELNKRSVTLVNEKGWINFPDYNYRLYRNNIEIKWAGDINDRLIGFDHCLFYPPEEHFSLYHIKTMEKQKEQLLFIDQCNRDIEEKEIYSMSVWGEL